MIYGHVDDVYGCISYESEILNGVEHAFREAVDDYLDTCEELGICPEPKVKVLARRVLLGQVNVQKGGA